MDLDRGQFQFFEPPEHEIKHINNLFRSNYGSCTPDPELISKSLDSLALTEREIQRTSDDIHRLESQLACLKAEKRGLEWRAARYRSLLAPIRSLPPKIITLIFESFCSEAATFTETLWSPPAQLSHVCSGWRELVRGTPILWSSIHIEDAVLYHPSEKVISMLTTHIHLSRQTPLNLSISMSGPGAVDHEDTARLILQMLFGESRRWREVHLDLHEFFYDDLDDLRGNLPLLQVLYINDWDNVPDLHAFEIAENLRGVYLSYAAADLGLPWSQITEFSIGSASASEALEGLSMATEAREVTLYRTNLDYLPDEFPIVHNLNSLSIIVDRWDPDFQQFFDWLTLPNLTSLSITGAEESPPRAFTDIYDDTFPSFIARSSCTITSLSLIDLPLTDSAAIVLLSALPSHFPNNPRAKCRNPSFPKHHPHQRLLQLAHYRTPQRALRPTFSLYATPTSTFSRPLRPCDVSC
ncbi:hypothetical protein D9758_003527 [Tetrapyrgos nigripes]|uniref:F-box domain-containing protein n=1 Tax=Tetrapyrgos nigripes TaxID=182062 RepID=A0A8H5LW80_9AGAR|nr:hypothetical protein D9758_003527 [Tetrapyrgos nigripes]